MWRGSLRIVEGTEVCKASLHTCYTDFVKMRGSLGVCKDLSVGIVLRVGMDCEGCNLPGGASTEALLAALPFGKLAALRTPYL